MSDREEIIDRTSASKPPKLRTAIPGPCSIALAARLGTVECQNVTCLTPEAPIFLELARGANLWDVDGNRFVDLGAAFGVAGAGHAHPAIVRAVSSQAEQLMHAMGDVYPATSKVELLEALTARYPGGAASKGVLSSSGSDAVETAIKTALLASGKPGLIAFEGAYHGLSLGALDATWRADFREPFATRLPCATSWARFGDLEDVLRCAASATQEIGAVIVEPIQGRGGERIPPPGFLRTLRSLCDERGWLLIADEIYTGCGRTGRFFACEYEEVVPDLLCLGKGLSSGMPISACLGRSEVMDAWPLSKGEALHTQTYIGHPPSCAAALASLRVIEEEGLVERAATLGEEALSFLRDTLSSHSGVIEVRGRGLMIGIECDSSERALRACSNALARGVVLLASGDDGRCLGITPPLVIDRAVFRDALEILVRCL